MGGDEPAELLAHAIESLHRLNQRSYLLVALTGLAAWWALSDELEAAAQVVGFLEVADPGGNQTFADVRAEAARLVAAHPKAPVWRGKGATKTRDEIVAYCLDQLSTSR